MSVAVFGKSRMKFCLVVKQRDGELERVLNVVMHILCHVTTYRKQYRKQARVSSAKLELA